MAAAPAYAATPILGAALINNGTPDTNFSTPSHATLVVTAGANGSKIDEIDLIPAGTISSGGVVVNLYLYNGTTYYLLTSVLVPAVTPATQVPSSLIQLPFDAWVLPAGWSIYATETVASQPVQVTVWGGSY